MYKLFYFEILLTVTVISATNGWNGYPNDDCGPYGFTCERNNRVRLCNETRAVGPAFICPPGTFCNEESTNVCEDAINHIDPALTRKLRCHRNERIPNPNVANCKGYILCIPNGSRFQGINFKCSGNTIFNTYTRTCTSSSRYKCPQENTTKSGLELYNNDNRKDTNIGSNKPYSSGINFVGRRPPSIECKNYKFRITQDYSPNQATYFCPPRPVSGEDTIRCTIFSNHFCITLARDDEDLYGGNNTPYRKPRT